MNPWSREGQVVHRPLALGRGRRGARERLDHQVGDPARGLHVAGGDRGRRPRVQQASLGRDHLDRAEGARGGRRLGVGEHADGEEGGRLGDRQGAVEVAVDLRIGAGEVERQPVRVDPGGDPQADVARLAAGVRLHQVLGLVRAVGQLGEPGARAALGVVEDLRHPGAKHPDAVPARQLEQATLAGQVGGPLRAQVGEPLARVAHLGGKARQPVVVGPGGRDHHALVLEPGRAGRHPGRGRPADVRVMGAAGGEAEQGRLRPRRARRRARSG